MSKREILKFPNRVKFWQHIHSLDDKLDFNNTMKLSKTWFYYDGNKYVAPSFKATLGQLNELIGTRFDTKHSIAVGSRYTVFIEPLDVQSFEEVLPEEEVVEDEPSVETDEFELSLLDLDSDEDEESTEQPDWGWVGSLENTKKDKQRLDEYAAGFGVSLKRTMTLNNMIKAFKEEYEG